MSAFGLPHAAIGLVSEQTLGGMPYATTGKSSYGTDNLIAGVLFGNPFIDMVESLSLVDQLFLSFVFLGDFERSCKPQIHSKIYKRRVERGTASQS